MTDKERIAALAALARDILDMYVDAKQSLIHQRYKFSHGDDIEQFSLSDTETMYSQKIDELSGDEE